jgi:hypothetical protein
MNYKIRITPENQAIVKRIADENGMNPYNYMFNNFFQYYTISNNLFDKTVDKSNFTEITTEQFIAMFDKKETEPRKIIGYKAPFDLGGHKIKGELFKLTSSDFGKWYDCKYDDLYQISEIVLPSEIVETWEPVFEPLSTENKKEDKIEIDSEIYAEENAKDDNISYHNLFAPLKYAFINGAKWQSEQPKETDFKTKVIDLIEKRIKDKKEKLQFVIDKNNLIYEAVLECIVAIETDLLKQIKEL